MEQAFREFRAELRETIAACRKIGYFPNRFAGMVNGPDPFEAVRTLLHGSDVSDGFSKLWEKQRLDLSVEAIILKPKWHRYFSDEERIIARDRLAEVGFHALWDDSSPSAAPANPEVERLLQQLAGSKGDRAEGKRIRARLRSLGHRGGLRGSPIPKTCGETETTPTNYALPPIAGAETFLERIRSLTGLPERNHEDLVKDLLLLIGHQHAHIVFQQGRVDVRLLSDDGRTSAIVEVKRSIASESERLAARRQAMDYAGKTGAIIIVVTDGDRYEIYDRRKGFDYDAMLCGRFQLTAFRDDDRAVFDLLRPSNLQQLVG